MKKSRFYDVLKNSLIADYNYENKHIIQQQEYWIINIIIEVQ